MALRSVKGARRQGSKAWHSLPAHLVHTLHTRLCAVWCSPGGWRRFPQQSPEGTLSTLARCRVWRLCEGTLNSASEWWQRKQKPNPSSRLCCLPLTHVELCAEVRPCRQQRAEQADQAQRHKVQLERAQGGA